MATIKRSKLAEVARGRVFSAVQRGDLDRPELFECADCDARATQWDHRDYRKPLDVEAVCDPCNRKRPPALPLGDVDASDAPWYSPADRRTKDAKLQIRMYVADLKALKALAAGEGLSMAAYLARLVRKEAKKQGIPT